MQHIAVAQGKVLVPVGLYTLPRYELACELLSEARTVDEAKGIRDRAEAARAYARQAGNLEAENNAVAIRTAATLALGDRLLELKADGHIEGRFGKKARCSESERRAHTLDDLGIDRKLSMRAQKLAELPRQETLDAIEHWRERANKMPKRLAPPFRSLGPTPIKMRRPTRLYMMVCDLMEARRTELGLSMEQMSDLMGSADRSYAKIIKPDTPSGRLAEWSTVQDALDVLGAGAVRIEWGEPGSAPGVRRKVNAERAEYRRRHGGAMPRAAA